MTTPSLIDETSDGLGLTKNDCDRVIKRFLERIGTKLQLGYDVRLHKLGTLKVQERARRATNFGRPNPHAHLPAVKQVTFRDAEDLRDRLNPNG